VLDFYTTSGDIIDKAISEFHRQHIATRRGQLQAVEQELKQVTSAIDRYLTAFEKGTPDDEDAHIRARLATLKTKPRGYAPAKPNSRSNSTSRLNPSPPPT
jgi:site-specific DNA recombinase